MREFIEQHKRWIGLGLIVISAVVLFYVVSSQRAVLSEKLKNLEDATSDSLTLYPSTVNPPPLRNTRDTQDASVTTLTTNGVLQSTNTARRAEGLANLTVNASLNKMAEQKLRDMFTNQYFEHISPTGVSADDLAKNNNYEYIIIGENLALGNFSSDAALVNAWMESPGHRANILNPRYREIGIATGQGLYEGKLTWLTVQEFGLSVTACGQPSVQDKNDIDVQKKAIVAFEAVLREREADIQASQVKYSTEYNTKVQNYNELVRQYNALVVALKAKINTYNAKVSAFNTCATATSTQAV